MFDWFGLMWCKNGKLQLQTASQNSVGYAISYSLEANSVSLLATAFACFNLLQASTKDPSKTNFSFLSCTSIRLL